MKIMNNNDQSNNNKDNNIISNENDNKEIFHTFLFNIRNYSPEVINIQRRKVEYYITESE